MSEPSGPEDGTRRPAGPRTHEQGASVLTPDPPGPTAPNEPAPARGHGTGGRAGRFWCTRRIPAAVLALVVLGGSGLLLYDVAAVRADHPAMQWRRSLADDLAKRPLDDVWVLAGSAAAMAVGLWLLLLALTPGLRALLPMRRDHEDVRAGLDRKAAELVLRDRAVEVSGVQSVRVRMGRAKAKVHAVSHFRELDDVRADLESALADGVGDLGLARPPSLSVHVRRPAKKG
ncbi:DUF6286 domain-containing protein [Streptomyces sp. DT24]|uniref:DUF6286 domain-containing protein n=1 Tax=unclassified Streptomyces TaxID=2593676 RepID=UPI0023B95784|nr:DUF6286 domain-containing protein [Streptomyces sp. AM 4-1-1]WEH32776.1 DUF6286 domain-containing protein [Streptomyces sp. AM 4-1-1]